MQRINQNLSHTPARQPGGKRTAPHRPIHYLNIPGLQKDLIVCESLLERDCALILALDPQVIRIEYQPETINLGSHGEYTPDFRVIYKSGLPSYIEVKPSKFAYEKNKWEKISAAFEYYKALGMHYEWISEWEIEKKDRHLKAAYIHRNAKIPMLVEHTKEILDVVGKHAMGISIGEVKALTNLSTEHILHCVGNRWLKLNHFFEYDDTSLVFPLQGESK